MKTIKKTMRILTLFFLSPDLIGANDVIPIMAVCQVSGLSPLKVNSRVVFSEGKLSFDVKHVKIS